MDSIDQLILCVCKHMHKFSYNIGSSPSAHQIRMALKRTIFNPLRFSNSPIHLYSMLKKWSHFHQYTYAGPFIVYSLSTPVHAYTMYIIVLNRGQFLPWFFDYYFNVIHLLSTHKKAYITWITKCSILVHYEGQLKLVQWFINQMVICLH